MLKIRVTFVDDGDKGIDEINSYVSSLKEDYNVLDQSRIYKGRNGSKFSNIYLTVEKKEVSQDDN